jgi:hypothetical protein
MQQAAAAGPLLLRSFTTTGALAQPDLLRQLPAAHLTQLRAEIGMHDSGSMDAVQALTNLRSLTLYDRHAAFKAPDPLYHLTTALQQLTQLRLGMISPVHLVFMSATLPPQLQQLHMEVNAMHDAQ